MRFFTFFLTLSLFLTSTDHVLSNTFSSSMECEEVDAGTIAFSSGTDNITLLADGIPDIITFTSSLELESNTFEFRYLITSLNGTIESIQEEDTFDFETLGLGVSRIYGLAYTGSLNIAVGENLSLEINNISTECFDLSDNRLIAIRLENQPIDQTFFISSNTSNHIGVNRTVEGRETIIISSFMSGAEDADGIFYDEDTDILYQLNRSTNAVDAYEDALAKLNSGTIPTVSSSSTSDFTNGREITYSNGKLIVAQDEADDNEGNQLIVYDVDGPTMVLDKVIDIDINLWGIDLSGSTLYAVEDNSNNLVQINNMFGQAGPIEVTEKISVEGVVRTHGLVYVPESDMMLITDIGDAAMDDDGAIIRIRNYSSASMDGNISISEQIRVEGGSSFLGNPVDISYDKDKARIYVAERARNGGMILCFPLPVASGSVAPTFKQNFPGASAIYFPGLEVDACEELEVTTVNLIGGGTESTIIIDGIADNISFESSSTSKENSFTFVVTNDAGDILAIPGGNMVDFDPAGLGICRVYGLSYLGRLLIEEGDNLLGDSAIFAEICANISSNYITINRIDQTQSEIQFYTSSNTSGLVGIFNVFDDNVIMTGFPSSGMDADGIFYDEDNDVLYQLDRTNNVVNAYGDLRSRQSNGTAPSITASSSSDFSNGRGIAYSNGKLIVAQDESDTNGGNKIIIYNASASEITLDKVFDVEIDLWGIHADGNTLYAVVDNSSEIATFENIFENESILLTPSTTTNIEGMVRTHGLVYISDLDMMLLTDVGDAASSGDGALVRIKKFTEVSSDGRVSPSEQIRVAGGTSLLGNPVDIAYDQNSRTVYVAENARNGGMILGYKLPILSGGIAPIYKKVVAGASSVTFPGSGELVCDLIDGGVLSLSTGGTEATILIDGIADVLSFTSSGENDKVKYTYVVTDSDGVILGIPSGNSVDFDPPGVGLCRVYGVAYNGDLLISVGDNFLRHQIVISDDCFDVSDNFLTVNRLEAGSSDLQFFTSSSTTGNIGIYSILAGLGNIASQSFTGNAMDGEGIFYDEASDVLYQVNRTNTVIDLYGSVKESLQAGNIPAVIASSTSDFSNGKEIAVIDGRLVVAQAADDSNDGNKLIVYDVTPTTITYAKEHAVDFDLASIFATGNTLFASENGSSNVAIFSDFFNMSDGPLEASSMVMIEDMVSTGGIIYDFNDDMLVLTDVGDISDEDDGAIVVIRNWGEASADDFVSSEEQARAFAGAAKLGSPVDITLDKPGKVVYVSERLKNGGLILGFKLPKLTGGIAPIYQSNLAFASAIHLPGLEVGICEIANGGEIALSTGGSEVTIFVDDEPDMISFSTSVPAEPVGFNFNYIITDESGKILAIPTDNVVDFNGAGEGTCFVYGLSYVGDLIISVDDVLSDFSEYSTDCSDLSDNRLTVNRIAPEAAVAQLFASSNTAGQIAVFNILASNAKVNDFIDIMNADADGIFYDTDADVLYQLNRTDNVIHAYSDVSSALVANETPEITATSTSDFTNGREITWMGDKLIVAEDANDTNGGNQFFIYDASPSSITLDKVLKSEVDVWGILALGSSLIAVKDNSGSVVIMDDFLGHSPGVVLVDKSIAVTNLLRTHGLAYDAASDKMILTDIGDAEEDGDGAIVMITDWTAASADGMISELEQVRIDGDSTLLGNPVDVAYDASGGSIYVAERANNGGRILGFNMSDISMGEYKPGYIYNFEGASAVAISGDISALRNAAVSQRNAIASVSSLYPSPTSQELNVEIDSKEDVSTQIQIFDMTGKLMMTENISLSKGGNLIKLNVRNLNTGFHYINVPSLSYSEKFLKIR